MERLEIMNVDSHYLHTIAGRLRVKVGPVKGSPSNAFDVEALLLRLDGVDEATANPRTGNVLVLYDWSRLTEREILHALRAAGWLPDKTARRSDDAAPPRETLTQVLIRSSLEFALQRFLIALI